MIMFLAGVLAGYAAAIATAWIVNMIDEQCPITPEQIVTTPEQQAIYDRMFEHSERMLERHWAEMDAAALLGVKRRPPHGTCE